MNILNEIKGCNIFTDASITTNTITNENGSFSYYVGAPGAAMYDSDFNIADSLTTIIHNCTNNQSEILAILYGLLLGYKWARPGEVINIFSDSKISVFGLREWIFLWMDRFYKSNPSNGILVGSDGRTPVSNQTTYLYIVDTILKYNRPVRFYHVRGHKKLNSFKDRIDFQRSFLRENYMSCKLSEDFISYCMIGNDIVDNLTRNLLKQNNISNTTPDSLKHYPIDRGIEIFNRHDYIMSLDIEKYKSLIGGI